tara:strand:- start:348 stop:473 length:126 start_codon:yes stop_codon:yes gene_type:complete
MFREGQGVQTVTVQAFWFFLCGGEFPEFFGEAGPQCRVRGG